MKPILFPKNVDNVSQMKYIHLFSKRLPFLWKGGKKQDFLEKGGKKLVFLEKGGKKQWGKKAGREKSRAPKKTCSVSCCHTQKG